ncbi:hypothetical protein LEMA_P106430.1 [Plenodomus lingam JN3]|uniref:Mediator of RNA polymerase II transcription subunit 20 n=2 Tax=Leptosphaeria maculans TaxID=5022 RepID=E5A156_LEPMJ|nr:hypothetical protein LEMA_P106430.1 [Plenodomus lingam JN3]CBX97512.1 hypothetical protein LEMA_P106430.1 [Plenodomus lingam JN3]
MSLDASLTIVNALVQAIETQFPSIRRDAPWSLNYRAFREANAPKDPPPMVPDAEGNPARQPPVHAYQHLLHHSSLDQNRTFICIQNASSQATVTSIPLQQQDAHVFTMRQYMAALWAPRHTLTVQQGVTYSAGMFTIHLAELRATREGPQSGAIQSPGVVCCISMSVGLSDSDDEGGNMTAAMEEQVDFESTQQMIRACWNMIRSGRDIGRSEVQETMMAPTLTSHKERGRESAVRLWCDVLRLRG